MPTFGSIATWLSTHDATLSYTRFHEAADLPDVSGVDLLIVMGGPMSVNDEEIFPWLRPEKRFIRELGSNSIWKRLPTACVRSFRTGRAAASSAP
jgi:GMP synthase-like glutamine amidotransferase